MKWSNLPLEQFVDFYNGKSIKPSEKGNFPAFGSNGIIGYSENYLYDKGIIIGRVGANCGSVEISLSNFWPSDNTIVAKPKSNADLVFVYYLLKNYPLNSYAGGSAQPLLTQTVLKPIKFKIPEYPTQRKIASILSAYDDLIENNLKRIKLLEEKAQLHRERLEIVVRQHIDASKKLFSSLPRLESISTILEENLKSLENNSIWTKTKFNDKIQKLCRIKSESGYLELLPSQRDALGRNLLDVASNVTVVQMPTSAGKTLLAEFNILVTKALKQNARIVYIVPSRALVNQIYHDLKNDLEALELTIEKDIFCNRN